MALTVICLSVFGAGNLLYSLANMILGRMASACLHMVACLSSAGIATYLVITT